MHARGDLAKYLGEVEAAYGAPVFHVIASDGNQWDVIQNAQPMMEKYPQISGVFSMNDGLMYFQNKNAEESRNLSLATYSEMHERLPSVILEANVDDGMEKLRILDGIFANDGIFSRNVSPLSERLKRVIRFDTFAGRNERKPKSLYHQTLAAQVAEALKQIAPSTQLP